MTEDTDRTRAPITVRLRPWVTDWLDSYARANNLHRSDVIRAAFAVAMKHEGEFKQVLAGLEKRL